MIGVSLDGRSLEVETRTPEELLMCGLQSYQKGQYQQAVECWSRFVDIYEAEASPQSSGVERRLLPLLGYSLYLLNQYEESQQYLLRYLQKSDNNKETWVLLLAGKNRASSGDMQGALQMWKQIRNRGGEGVDVALSLWYQAEHLLLADHCEEGMTVLEELREIRGVPSWMYADAALRAAGILKDQGQYKEASQIMLKMNWDHGSQVDPYGRMRLVLELAGGLLQEGESGDALLLLRGVVPGEAAGDLQNIWLGNIREWMSAQVGFNPMQGFNPLWREYLAQLYQRSVLHQQAIASQTNDTVPFYLTYAQVLLQEKRLREAWIVLEEVSLDEKYEKDGRQQAHYMWIVTACRMGRWQDAALLIESYADLYPDSQAVIDVSYMMVQVLSGEEQYGAAIDLLTELIQSYPNHSMQERWRYHRGYLRIRERQYEIARVDFSWGLSLGGNGKLRYECMLWSGLSYLFENNPAQAANLLRDGLNEISHGHLLHPDFLYWTASAEYSLQQEHRAESLLDDYLLRYPLHFRVEEAISLKGDLRMRAGDFSEALFCFRRIGNDSHMYPHAMFRIAEILQHRGDATELEQHLFGYVRQEIDGEYRRVAEALRWLVKFSSKESLVDNVLPCYAEVLEHCGNRLDVTEAMVLLKDFAGLLNNNQVAANRTMTRDWLARQQDSALHDRALTWYGRLIYLEVLLSEGELDVEFVHSRWLGLRSVSLAEMDAEITARLGVALLNHSERDEARIRCEHVLGQTSDPEALVIANYGMSRLLLNLGQYEEAIEHGERVHEIMPDHRLSAKVTVLQVESCLALAKYEEVIRYCDRILQNRRYRGRTHAEFLMYKASAYAAMHEYASAILCYQRVYSIYRGYADLVMKACQESARLLESSGNLDAALGEWQKLAEWNGEMDEQTKVHAEEQRKRLAVVIRAAATEKM